MWEGMKSSHRKPWIQADPAMWIVNKWKPQKIAPLSILFVLQHLLKKKQLEVWRRLKKKQTSAPAMNKKYQATDKETTVQHFSKVLVRQAMELNSYICNPVVVSQKFKRENYRRVAKWGLMNGNDRKCNEVEVSCSSYQTGLVFKCFCEHQRNKSHAEQFQIRRSTELT